jgi:hypothetical protein
MIPRSSLGGRIRERAAHIDGVVLPDEHGARHAELSPGGEEVAVLVEDLDALVPAVGDVHALLRATDEDVVGLVEITRPRSFLSPRLAQIPRPARDILALPKKTRTVSRSQFQDFEPDLAREREPQARARQAGESGSPWAASSLESFARL